MDDNTITYSEREIAPPSTQTATQRHEVRHLANATACKLAPDARTSYALVDSPSFPRPAIVSALHSFFQCSLRTRTTNVASPFNRPASAPSTSNSNPPSTLPCTVRTAARAIASYSFALPLASLPSLVVLRASRIASTRRQSL